MKITNLLTAAAIAALPLTTHAAQLVIPAAGAGPGANGSQWKSNVTIHSAAPRGTSLTLRFQQGTTLSAPVEVHLGARQTVSIDDIVQSKFHATGTGALIVDVSERDARGIAITSRTANVLGDVEFGQDIPAVDVADALREGDTGALPGPDDVTRERFNFGIYTLEATTVEWQVVRANGTVAATRSVTYATSAHAQYNSGIESLLGVAPQRNDTVYARLASGRAIAYGSIVNTTGDPTFVPGIRTREDILIDFKGVDLDENGTIDVADANDDGVLDAPVDIATSMFDSYFKVVAEGEFGETVQYEIVSSPAQADILDENGTLRVAAGAAVKGTVGEIRIRAISGSSSQVLTIPVRFR
ncbi:MAG TPA: hypothetical protein VEK11_22055 [Thermoanaerobaculia bacterium]|nr:hypothetical protein [Thermoanaerobaculia bacterium]